MYKLPNLTDKICEIPDLGPYISINRYGIYAFKVGGEAILASNCSAVYLDENNDLWYKLGNKNNVIEVEERWIWVPYHSLQAIAFNNKLKKDEKVDDLPNRT